MELLTIRQQFLAIVTSIMILGFWTFPAIAEKPPDRNFSMNVMYMKEGNSPLTIEQAIDKYTAGRFVESVRQILSFGFGSQPVWIHLSISNLKFFSGNEDSLPVRKGLSLFSSFNCSQ